MLHDLKDMGDARRAKDASAPLDRERLPSLWDGVVDSLRSFFRRRLPDESAVDDTLQECFVRVLTGIDRLESEAKFGAWVQRIARNLVTDAWRARGQAGGGEEPPVEAVVSPEREQDLTRTVAGWLESVIGELPPDQAEILRAFELEGVSQRELAARHGLSVSAVKARVRRGRQQVRERLLACCDIEFDRSGHVLDWRRRSRRECGPDC